MTDERANSRVIGADTDLDLLFAQVQALRELASDPDKAQDSDRVYDFGIRWAVLLYGRLQRLDHYHHRSELAPDEQARYERLRAELREAVPLVERLGLPRPDRAFADADPR
ncbi:hypothetical protein [Haloactinomyces albus]|uniref:Uncharacterized protein n=1 Tax=Haloactinomyces albus TaxID=1352928 RepID=A0AAE4CLG3_9ACTN|nr:hypothetical protein [Haloactinomyces albus]MDR7299892.1 hypothetical protein [Haloactinomyces albus]